ncbi:hypothetical protein ANAPC1_01481 [Anaplasma phagocytophilum]|uniref:Uncharacterized protein n=1 Tax=Anaplasma phagocytophilum TaxID=948 RepID=A0AA45ZIB7_ANAPH|nr:hypothetical protein [Anaplasma phagocytophilum]SBO15103.1 hypothetical protein ANAPC1_01481 [Anaplasma phagocytophilum]SBO32481.1 hypothetical protein ANAPC2_01044 [Anaplasma phagocytophilum]SBO33729.1 hypothetical protein ANAPC3_01330 [Anaplasma phagocytophilum]SBO33890.1 hypothetical protein ANAPC4_01342 [Anaplasma phagocytophilum]SCV62755.1 hypothetical protein ANAPC5_00351 [Anaplasma phagocytophilum]
MKISHPDIDKKVCNGKHAAFDASGANVRTYGPDPKTPDTVTAQCSGFKGDGPTGENGALSKFVELTKIDEDINWPTGRYHKSGNIEKGTSNSNAKAVAKDLTKNLSHDEKIKVAGLLAKTIEGGEVVEIRAVSSIFIRI